ncbi:MAG: helix-turn-helix domain-containing protein [Actinomycetes bacterium]
MDAAQMIIEARSQAGISRRQLARLAGTSPSTLSAYEEGRSIPSVVTLQRILAAAGFRVDASLVAVDEAEHRRRGEALASLLDLADAYPRPARQELAFPLVASMVVQ